MRITITASDIVAADLTRRTLTGTVYRYGETGHTSAGPLRVGATMPPPPVGLDLTLEHDRAVVRGAIALVLAEPDALRVTCRVADGPLGDTALLEASERKRAAFSFDIEDAVVVDGEIVDGTWAALGQVADPAFNSARIDKIAASNPARPNLATPITGRHNMTDEQIARLAELRALESLSQDDALELIELIALEQNTDGEPAPAADPAAPAPAAAAAATAARASAPSGVPATRRPAARTAPRGLDVFVDTIVSALRPGGGGSEAITAALVDVTNTANPAVSAPGWSDELWSGVAYEPIFSPLLNSGPLTNWEGKGWRWVVKPAMADYAGDKAAIPSNAISTEPSAYEAARLAVGHDIDRKFYDFPDAGFLRGYVQAVGESTKMQLDDKSEAYIVNSAVAVSGAAASSLLKAAARVANRVTRARLGRATFIVVNEDDHEGLMDVTSQDVPAFLDLFGIKPEAFVPSALVPAGTVIGGVKNAATLRTLPGASPIRVSAQHLANGGIDEAFFAYWAIEEHHPAGILKTTFA